MNPYCAFPNVQAAATAVHRFHKEIAAPVELTARPYNRFEPVNTEWWLVPSTQWPAYQYGKLLFSYWATPDAHPMLFAGLNAEKGFGAVVLSIDPSRRSEIAKPEWSWYRIVDGLCAGALDTAVASVAVKAGMAAAVTVGGGYYQDMEPGDPYAERDNFDKLVFETTGKELVLGEHQIRIDLLPGLQKCRALSELGQKLAAVPNQDWAWMSLSIGISLRLVPLQPDAGLPAGAWDEAQLWDRALSPWLPWVR